MLSPNSDPDRDVWYQANFNYLAAAVARVYYYLDRHIASLQNGELPQSTLPDTEAIAAQMEEPPVIVHLCELLNLSEFEENILLLCVGRAMHPHFPELCALAQKNGDRNYPTFSLALSLFPDVRWQALTPRSPLRYWDLLHLAPGEDVTQARLQIDESILHYILGEPYQDYRLAGIVAAIAPELSANLSPSRLDIALETADLLISPQINPSTSPIVQLCGADIEDRLAIAQETSKLLNFPLYILSTRHLPTAQDDLQHLLTSWHRTFRLTSGILLLECDPLNFTDKERQTALANFLQGIETPLLLSSPTRFYTPHRAFVTFDIPPLTYQEQLHLWESSLGDRLEELNGHLPAIAAQFNLSPATIQTASHVAQQNTNTGTNMGDRLWNFCRIQARPRLDDLAQRIETKATWEDLILPEQQRQILQEMLAHLRQRVKVYEDWGFAEKERRGLGISALFSGQSGTGKTTAAGILARELNLDLYRIDLSAVTSKYIGETEKNLKQVFDAAEGGGAILLFDEADAIFGKRSEVKDSRDRYANMEVSYLLQRIESYQGLAVLTTNLKTAIDRAFLRRIRFIITFPFPDTQHRQLIWECIFPTNMPREGLDFAKLANLSVTGGNIRNIALNAAVLAADANESVMMKHLLQAAKSEYVKLERTMTDKEIKDWV
ncbi:MULTISPECIES: ATP-binding protein [Spirulina sp. CCY15215]|uniref:ATP-binding protein n=1 Tax=Spirulina sp. CCY15215 TaxID=2767591 RepID=UPI001950520C|nr:ATP-binding protein [Spirulina major]